MAGGWRERGMNFQLPNREPVTGMVPMPDYLLVFQPSGSYSVRVPHVVDPAKANPELPWVVNESPLPGSRNPIVARLVLQPKQLIEQVGLPEKWGSPEFAQTCVSATEHILACAASHAAINEQVCNISARIAAGEVVVRDGLVMGLPQVTGLDTSCTQFLVNTKRAIRLLCGMVSYFAETRDKHSNFDFLLKELQASKFANTPLAEYVSGTSDQVRLLIDFRNFQEHPGDTVTVVENFRIAADGSIRNPCWQLRGERTTPLYSVTRMMSETVSFLVDCAEAIVIHGLMLHANPRYRVHITQIEPASRDPHCPVALQIRLHVARH